MSSPIVCSSSELIVSSLTNSLPLLTVTAEFPSVLFFIFIVKSVLIVSFTCSLKFQMNILLAVFSVAIGGVDAVTRSIFL